MGLGFRFASPLVATRWPKVWPRHAASPSLGQMLTVEEEPLGPKSTNYIGYCWLGGKLQNQLHWLAHTVVEFLGAEVVLRVAWACGTGAGAWKTTGAVWWGATFSGWGRGGSLRSICAEVSTTIFRSLDLFSQEKGVSFDAILGEMEKGDRQLCSWSRARDVDGCHLWGWETMQMPNGWWNRHRSFPHAYLMQGFLCFFLGGHVFRWVFTLAKEWNTKVPPNGQFTQGS